MMRIDFPQGVPKGCKEWLEQHVGKGLTILPGKGSVGFDECAWFYERRFEVSHEQAQRLGVTEGSYIPSITIRDGESREALLFALRWSGS